MRLIIFFTLLATTFYSQKDTCLSAPLVGIHLEGQLPGGDMVKRFGPNMALGATFHYKTSRNWIYGIDFSYLYGKTIKEDVVKQLRTAEGYVVDNAGNPADLRITERGAALSVTAGRVFRVFGSNKNSGLMISVGAGFLQHKINLYDAQQKIAAVKGELKYGYDRMTFGFSVNQFVGYMYLSKNRLLNFYFGVVNSQSFTHSLRKLNYDTGLRDTKERLDLLSGLRLGWILPIYKRMPNDYYYN